jgi:hypothetical protein
MVILLVGLVMNFHNIQHDLCQTVQAMGRAASLQGQGPTGARVKASVRTCAGNAGLMQARE